VKVERISVGLVACASTKAASPQPARLLYRSELFRRASEYAAATYDHWFILSARHYLVHPDERLAPYDQRVDQMNVSDREHWGATVEAGIRLGYGCMTDGRLDWPAQPAPRLRLGQWMQEGRDAGIDRRVDVWFHAGAAYVTPIAGRIARLPDLPYDLHMPLAHLGIGHQLAWYADHPPACSNLRPV
jgi:uncharacterized protein DUF6884